MLCPLQSISLGSFYFVTYFSFELRYFPELTHSGYHLKQEPKQRLVHRSFISGGNFKEEK